MIEGQTESDTIDEYAAGMGTVCTIEDEILTQYDNASNGNNGDAASTFVAYTVTVLTSESRPKPLIAGGRAPAFAIDVVRPAHLAHSLHPGVAACSAAAIDRRSIPFNRSRSEVEPPMQTAIAAPSCFPHPSAPDPRPRITCGRGPDL